jgi:outer membrane autotransporter protein
VPVNAATEHNSIAALAGLFNYGGVQPQLLNLFNASAALGSADAANHGGAQLSPAANTAAAVGASSAQSHAVVDIALSHLDRERLASSATRSGVSTGESSAEPGLWGQVFGGDANQSQRDGVSGYNANYTGLLIGSDALVTDTWRAGGLFSYAHTSVDDNGDNAGSAVKLDSFALIGYASYSGGPWYVDVTGGAALHQFDTKRSVALTGFTGVANGQHDGMQYLIDVRTGHAFKVSTHATITPIASLTYSTLRQNAYTETGGGGAALNVDSLTSNSLQSTVGMRFEHSSATSIGDLVPSVQIGWRHEFEDTRLQSVANFADDGSGSTSFTSSGPRPTAETAVLAVGATVVRSKHLSVSAKVTLEAAEGYNAKTADLKVRYEF